MLLLALLLRFSLLSAQGQLEEPQFEDDMDLSDFDLDIVRHFPHHTDVHTGVFCPIMTMFVFRRRESLGR